MQNNFRKVAKVALALVYLVIIAGAVVRGTGSGMGCPDWPKCFGHYIPPTEISELQWKPDTDIKKGQIIIVNETLQVASESFKTASTFNKAKWQTYTKHDYAQFNAAHTWIEYINRLLGALAGLATLILAVMSIRLFKTNKKITILSWLVVFGMGFQAWLGATVVYSVLEPVKITVHMVMALVIVAFLLYIIHLTKVTSQNPKTYKDIIPLLAFVLVMTLIQVVLGTQVRQYVDDQMDVLGNASKKLWLANADWQFYVHRSFSIVIVLLNIFLAQRIYKYKLDFPKINWVLLFLFIEAVSGIAMYYFHFPFASQPIHLVLASLLFGVQFYLLLEAISTKRSYKSL
ncbi:COX15/CtaA family protein [Zobellia uliginosa]|uniref:COX15/CtaA family protein n=1 Tax=Zobellia uliginosa TaxID=143224 RepID=UPI001C06D342|nr:COX15/CtaA family protein [Zobellia uliginosa]MBU2947053.1 COX15/CtaA family protein [Zobellia uliginosa]